MKKNTTLMKEYSDWLFEQNSIIYEKKIVLSEDTRSMLMDLGQFAASIIGSIAPLEATGIAQGIDFANGVIYIARKEYVFAMLSFLGAILPVVGDMFKEGGMIVTWLARLITSANEANTFGKFVAKTIANLPRIRQGLIAAIPLIRTHKEEIKEAIDDAAVSVQQAREQRSGEETKQLQSGDSEEESQVALTEGVAEDVGGAISTALRAFVNFLTTNRTMRNYLKDSAIVNELKNSLDELLNLFERALEVINRIQSENPNATDASNSGSTIKSDDSTQLNESFTYTDIRFKKLAGIID